MDFNEIRKEIEAEMDRGTGFIIYEGLLNTFGKYCRVPGLL
jgi:hypothetical protein